MDDAVPTIVAGEGEVNSALRKFQGTGEIRQPLFRVDLRVKRILRSREVERHHLKQADRAGRGDDVWMAARFDLHHKRRKIGIQLEGFRPMLDLLCPVLYFRREDR